MSQLPVACPITNGTMFFNKYKPSHHIGRGAFGEVWLARDQALKHDYAIKILDDGIEVDQRLREAQIGHVFTHNNLVRVHQADVATDRKVVIAMDFLPDGAVTTLANPKGFLPLPTAIRTMIDVLQGLEHLHLHNFFHNDVKPQNILRGPQGQAMLGDYGIVGFSPNGAPVLPSMWYALHGAPETTAGNGIEARTDIFQSGLTLFRLLVGLGTLEAKYNSLDQQGYENAIANGALITKADFPAFIPSAVSRVVMTAIDPDPNKRFQSALDMRRALEKLSFPGHWTVDGTGILIGIDNKHSYRFEQILASNDNSSFVAFKKNNASGRETKISEFTKKSISKSEARKLEGQFLKAVVRGKA